MRYVNAVYIWVYLLSYTNNARPRSAKLCVLLQA